METVSILAALGGGIASFLCPCHLSLIPVYLASLAGPELFRAESSNRRLPVFLHSIFFVLGLGLFLAIISILVTTASQFLSYNALIITFISSGLLIALGLYLILSIKFPIINYECRLPHQSGIKTGYLRSFLIGAIYSFVHSPCITPIMLSIMTLSLGTGNPWHAGGLMFIYFLGYGLPFLIAGATIGFLIPFFKKIIKYRNEIYIASGLLLIGAGVVILIRLI
jgi:cytochrome c-type biogenesis protein